MNFELLNAEGYRSWKKLQMPIAGFGRIWTMSGHNGAGKTTMGEAWSVLLYETAPSKGKGIAKYIRNVPTWGDKEAIAEKKKKKEMPVLKMEGFLIHGGFRYRIIRTFDPNLKQSNHMLAVMKKPADLPIDGWDETDGAKVINGQTIADTQEVIEKLFGNYRAFITSTFMSGGVSGFLDSGDEEREESAAFLFGCEGYDKRLQIANEKRLAIDREIEKQTSNVPALLEVASHAEEHCKIIQVTDNEIKRKEIEKTASEKCISEAVNKREETIRAITQCESELKQADMIQGRILALEQKRDNLINLMENQAEIREKVGMLKSARETIKVQQEKYNQTRELQAEIEKNKQAIEAEKQRLMSLAQQIEKSIAMMAPIDIDVEYKKLGDYESRFEFLKNIYPAIEENQKNISKMQQNEVSLKEKIVQKQARIEEISESLDLIQAAAGCCPTCEREFENDTSKNMLIDKFKNEKHDLNLSIDTTLHEVAAIRNTLVHLEKEKALLQENQNEYNTITAEISMTKQRIQQAEQQAAELKRLKDQYQIYRETLDINEYAEGPRAKLYKAQEDIEAIGFNQEAYNQALTSERECLQAEADMARIEKAEEDLRQIKADIDLETETFNKLNANEDFILALRDRMAKITTEITILTSEQKTAQEAINQAKADKMASQALLEAALKAKEEAETIQAGQAELRKKQAILRVLEGAFAPRGIPKMKYDRYLPALTNKVNYALSVISPGWQVNITSQITSRGKFTIPIDVTSPEGLTDVYSSHSGGERFIIALSFLIGQGLFWGERTGAQPQHIIIDEGFGVLDPENMEKAKAAVSATASNFGQVGIISHLPELQSMGQVQIQVYKTKEEGSIYEMAGSGSTIKPRIAKRFWFEEDQLQAINSGISIMKEAIPGISDEKAIELSVAETAVGMPAKKKRGSKNAH